MNGDRDEIRGGWNTPVDESSDAEPAEMTGEFTIDYTPPAWYTQSASGDSSGGAGSHLAPPPPPHGAPVPGLPADAISVRGISSNADYQLALSPAAYTALRAWLESSPPGFNVNVA